MKHVKHNLKLSLLFVSLLFMGSTYSTIVNIKMLKQGKQKIILLGDIHSSEPNHVELAQLYNFINEVNIYQSENPCEKIAIYLEQYSKEFISKLMPSNYDHINSPYDKFYSILNLNYSLGISPRVNLESVDVLEMSSVCAHLLHKDDLREVVFNMPGIKDVTFFDLAQECNCWINEANVVMQSLRLKPKAKRMCNSIMHRANKKQKEYFTLLENMNIDKDQTVFQTVCDFWFDNVAKRVEEYNWDFIKVQDLINLDAAIKLCHNDKPGLMSLPQISLRIECILYYMRHLDADWNVDARANALYLSILGMSRMILDLPLLLKIISNTSDDVIFVAAGLYHTNTIAKLLRMQGYRSMKKTDSLNFIDCIRSEQVYSSKRYKHTDR